MMSIRLIALAGLAMALVACTPPPYQNIDNTELRNLMAAGVPLYDIRRPDEWRETGVIPGSRLRTFVDANGRPQPEFLPRLTAEVAKDQPVILICRVGSRTAALARFLAEELGYTQVYNVRQGIVPWLREKHPIEQVTSR